MRQLRALTAYLVSLDLVDAENIDSWAEDPKIIQRGLRKGLVGDAAANDALVLYRQTYNAVIEIERYPHRRHSAELLFAHVVSWLMTHDCERNENAKPEVEVDILDDETADVQIVIEFEEDVEVVSDPAGTIVIDGTNYALAELPVWIADAGEVTT